MVLTLDEYGADECAAEASRVLAAGGVAILPTDTIYGISGLAPYTENRIRRIKGRDSDKPFIRLIGSPAHLSCFTRTIPPPALYALWPGPVTFVVLDICGESTAYRCPGAAWLRGVILNAGGPIFSTSVNRSSMPPLTDIQAIIESYEDKVDLIINGGDLGRAEPSAIVDITNEGAPRALRGNLDISGL